MSRYDDIYAECPYYMRIVPDKKKIVCKGYIEGTTLDFRFTFKDTMKYQCEYHCQCHYQQCPMYRMITKELEDD